MITCYDIVFISYAEPTAEENYQNLKQDFPFVKRIHGVKGIHRAHVEAAKIVNTDCFFVVDGDAVITNDFKFDYFAFGDTDTVRVWRSINPINNLEYGYGGVKLLPTQKTLYMDTTTTDMTTSISDKFEAMPVISNITAFNTDPFNTWKSAFRECAKLASKTIDRQNEDETNERLKTWTSVAKGRYSEYALDGARSGMEFGLSNSNDLELINDFVWLEEQFNGNT